jgi:magnesium transporter
MVIEISHIGRTIHNFRQVLLGHEEMLKALEPASARLYGPEFSFYMRSAQNEYAHVRTILNHLRDSLLELRETNNSLLTAKQNEVIKVLTMMAFIIFPLTLIAGIFSMHTQYTPIIGTAGDFWIVLGIMVAVAAGILIYFVRKGWL